MERYHKNTIIKCQSFALHCILKKQFEVSFLKIMLRFKKLILLKYQKQLLIDFFISDLLPLKDSGYQVTREFLLSVVEILIDFIKKSNDRSTKVVDFHQPDQLMQVFDFSIPEDPQNLDQLLVDCKDALKYQVKTVDSCPSHDLLCFFVAIHFILYSHIYKAHPHYFNQLSCGLDIVSLAGEWLTATANTNMFTYEIAPIFILMEHFILKKMREVIGFPNGDSILAPGGAISNMYAILVARHTMFPEYKCKGLKALPQMVLYTSEHSHYSVKGAGATCGFGTDNVIEVPCDVNGRMIPEELERLVKEAYAKGHRPFFVNCTCGTTVLGAFDPINPLADICEKYNMWLHIDAAWGGGCLLSPKHRNKLNGVERARSITWNPHKLMGSLLQCSTVHFRENVTF
ncbi:glutamate decarboxylase-like protein [Leptotrombidium deliense]|uniref:Glutamate decarboxylase-like protein n=1 Tax=Leptotrombidium deliense TaxID=299467 RepID=A0A443S7V1_9ACAR|nr:glutamate decarboxylase-like protein [Leptotrombidium deliense]